MGVKQSMVARNGSGNRVAAGNFINTIAKVQSPRRCGQKVSASAHAAVEWKAAPPFRDSGPPDHQSRQA